MRPTFLLVLALAAAGCATNLSTLQTAKTLRPGQIRFAGGTGVYIPAGQAAAAAGEGVKLVKNGLTAAATQQPMVVTNDDRNAVITAVTAAVVMPPGNLWEASLRVGLVDNVDVGFRYSVNSVRLDGKWRLLHRGDIEDEGAGGRRSYDLAVGVGVSKYLFNNPVVEALEFVHLAQFNRWDVEVPIYLSADFNPYFGIYAAPKYVYSHTTIEGELVALSQSCGCDEKYALPGAIDMHFFGATAGLRAGLPRLSFFAEITAGHTMSHPMVLGKPRDLGGLTLYPAIGLAATFR
jgi:hypothetical protein